jgi:hypothetical protein
MSNGHSRSISRQCNVNVNAISETERSFSAIRKAQDTLNGTDTRSFTFFYIRSVPDIVQAEHDFGYTRGFFRGLLDCAGSIAETVYGAEYHRKNSDTVQTTGAVFRGLLIFARIVTKVFVRDYLLGRFLKSKAELSLKSYVSRVITLESKIVEK